LAKDQKEQEPVWSIGYKLVQIKLWNAECGVVPLFKVVVFMFDSVCTF